MEPVDPFKPFENWLKEKWKKSDNENERQDIVDENRKLIEDLDQWRSHTKEFEAALARLVNEKNIEQKRSEYVIHFDGADFRKAKRNFSGLLFPCSVVFFEAKFGHGDVNFQNAKFKGADVDFDNAVFGDGRVFFNGADFGTAPVSFDQTKFGNGLTSFSAVKFGNRTDFDHTDFGDGNVVFDKAIFGGSKVVFERARFGEGKISFTEANFGDGHLQFGSVRFGDGEVLFDRAKFGLGTQVFDGARFGDGDVSFRDVEFLKGTISFNKTNFGDDDVSFAGAKVTEGTLQFLETRFGEGQVSFDRVKLGKGHIQIQDLSLASSTKFSAERMVVEGDLTVRASFPNDVSFEGLEVGGIADFSHSEFVMVPDFRHAKFDKTLEVSQMSVGPPKMDSFAWCPFAKAKEDNDVRKFRKLKSMAQLASDHEMTNRFFALEMMAKRGSEIEDRGGLLVNWLYFALSGYGQSLLRPLAAMAASWVGFFLFYWSQIVDLAACADRAFFAGIYSLRHAVPLANTIALSVGEPSSYESRYERIFREMVDANVNLDLLQFAGMVQQFIGLLFFFLFLLALRNRFRLG